MRLRHNKKRNTAFVYEALVREMTKGAIKNDKNKINKIKSIVKEHFSKDSILRRELEIYKSLYETSGMQGYVAEKLVLEAKVAYSRLDKSKIFKEQSSLIKTINRTLSTSVFSNFVPNYKNLASLYSIFNDSVDVKEKVLLEQKVLESLMKEETKEKSEKAPIDNLVYKSFVKRFNEKYENQLSENQKVILTKYVTSFVDDGLELKVLMNEEVGVLKNRIKNAITNPVIASDPEMVKKTKQVLESLQAYKDREIDLVMIEEVLKIQSLVGEIEKDGD